jgi:hypothetical protein
MLPDFPKIKKKHVEAINKLLKDASGSIVLRYPGRTPLRRKRDVLQNS